MYCEHLKTKFHSTGRHGIMLGYTDHGTYTVELFENKHTVESLHVMFEERSFPALENMDSSSSSWEDDRWNISALEKSDTSSEGENSDEYEPFASEFVTDSDLDLSISNNLKSNCLF